MDENNGHAGAFDPVRKADAVDLRELKMLAITGRSARVATVFLGRRADGQGVQAEQAGAGNDTAEQRHAGFSSSFVPKTGAGKGIVIVRLAATSTTCRSLNGRLRRIITFNGGPKNHGAGAVGPAELAYATTTELTADDVHGYGRAEVARIRGEMETIKRAVGFEGTLQEFFVFLREDPQLFFSNTDDGLRASRQAEPTHA